MPFAPADLLAKLRPGAAPGAPAAPRRPMRTQVHAVKRVAGRPEGEDDTREWYAVELTVTALDLRTAWSWLPTALHVKAEDQPADEAPWGSVAGLVSRAVALRGFLAGRFSVGSGAPGSGVALVSGAGSPCP